MTVTAVILKLFPRMLKQVKDSCITPFIDAAKCDSSLPTSCFSLVFLPGSGIRRGEHVLKSVSGSHESYTRSQLAKLKRDLSVPAVTIYEHVLDARCGLSLRPHCGVRKKRRLLLGDDTL